MLYFLQKMLHQANRFEKFVACMKKIETRRLNFKKRDSDETGELCVCIGYFWMRRYDGVCKQKSLEIGAREDQGNKVQGKAERWKLWKTGVPGQMTQVCQCEFHLVNINTQCLASIK